MSTIEIYQDPSDVGYQAKQHNPHLHQVITRELYSRALWRWLEEGKLRAARLVLTVMAEK